MRLPALAAAVLVTLLTACATPPASPTPSAAGGGVEGLVSALAAASASVRQADRFDAAPLPGQGVLLCVGREEVRVYVFTTEQARRRDHCPRRRIATAVKVATALMPRPVPTKASASLTCSRANW